MKRVLFAFVVFLPFLINCLSVAEHENEFRGAPFTSPSKLFPMPDEWVKRPIRYENWTKKADVAIVLEQDLYHLILPLINKYAKDNNLNIVVKEGTCGIAA